MYRDTIFMIIVHPEKYRDTVFTIIVCLDLYHDTVFIGGVVPCCSAVARALLCVSSLCWCSRPTRCFPKFSLEIHRRKGSNGQASQLKERVNWKASRATSGAAYFCGVRISGVEDHVGTWLSCVADQVGNLEPSVSTRWDLAIRSQLSCEGFW